MSTPSQRNTVEDLIRAFNSGSSNEEVRTLLKPIRSATTTTQQVRDLQGSWLKKEEETGESSALLAEKPQLSVEDHQESEDTSSKSERTLEEKKTEVGENSAPPAENQQLSIEDHQGFEDTSSKSERTLEEEKTEIGESSTPPAENPQLPTEDHQESEGSGSKLERNLEDKAEIGESSALRAENLQLPTEDHQRFGDTSGATSLEFVIINGVKYTNEVVYGDEFSDDEMPESDVETIGEETDKSGAGKGPDTLTSMVGVAGHAETLLIALGKGLLYSLKTSGATVEKDFLASIEENENPILLLSRLANDLLPAHQKLSESLRSAEKNRNGLERLNLADIVIQFLNSVQFFEPLMEMKNKCIPEIQKMKAADRLLSKALGEFESIMGIEKGKSKVVKLRKAVKFPLEKIISTLLRTPTLLSIAMLTYATCANDEIERTKAEAAMSIVKKIKMKMEEKDLDLPDQAHSFSLNERSDGLFDALRFGRILVFDGKVDALLNGKLKKRHIVLFSDGLWLCKPKRFGDVFNMPSSRYLPFEFINVESHKTKEDIQMWTVSCTKSMDKFELVFKDVYDRMAMDSRMQLIKENFHSIQDHQFKSEANRSAE